MKRKHAKRIARALERIATAMEREPEGVTEATNGLGQRVRLYRRPQGAHGGSVPITVVPDGTPAGWARAPGYPPGAVVSLCASAGLVS